MYLMVYDVKNRKVRPKMTFMIFFRITLLGLLE